MLSQYSPSLFHLPSHHKFRVPCHGAVSTVNSAEGIVAVHIGQLPSIWKIFDVERTLCTISKPGFVRFCKYATPKALAFVLDVKIQQAPVPNMANANDLRRCDITRHVTTCLCLMDARKAATLSFSASMLPDLLRTES